MNNLYSKIQCPHCGANPQTNSISTGCKRSPESSSPEALELVCINRQAFQQYFRDQKKEWFNLGHVRIQIPDICNGCKHISFINTNGTLVSRNGVTSATKKSTDLQETHLCHSCNEEYSFTTTSVHSLSRSWQLLIMTLRESPQINQLIGPLVFTDNGSVLYQTK